MFIPVLRLASSIQTDHRAPKELREEARHFVLNLAGTKDVIFPKDYFEAIDANIEFWQKYRIFAEKALGYWRSSLKEEKQISMEEWIGTARETIQSVIKSKLRNNQEILEQDYLFTFFGSDHIGNPIEVRLNLKDHMTGKGEVITTFHPI